jgi:hypothetical protein
VGPESFQRQFAPLASGTQPEEPLAFGKALGKIRVQFGGNFADSALRLDNARDGDVRVRYSRISSS